MGNCLGFNSDGISAGSFASNFQSIHYGSLTPGNGWFALCQSRGASQGGTSSCTVALACTLAFFGILMITCGALVGVVFPGFLLNFQDLAESSSLLKDANLTLFNLMMYRLMIATGAFMVLAAVTWCCCGFSFVAFVMAIVFIGLTSTNVAKFPAEMSTEELSGVMMESLANESRILNATSPWDTIQQGKQ